mgnify:CR=1 FL=1
MSNLLNEAIIDAKALKEAALNHAEAAVIRKYSAEVKQTLDTLLEQEEFPAAAPVADPGVGVPPTEDPLANLGAEPTELGAEPEFGAPDDLDIDPVEQEAADIAPDVPLSAMDGLGSSIGEGKPVEFNVDLQALQEAVAALESELSEDEDIEINEIDLVALLEDDEVEITEDDDEDPQGSGEMSGDSSDGSEAAAAQVAATGEQDGKAMRGMEENVDSLADAIMEKLTVDMGADLSGWAGRSSDSMKFEIEKEMAHRRSTDVAEEMKDLKKAQEELVFENSHLSEKLSNYEQAVGQLKENLQDVNLSNARLLYTNRILRNTSLNERQKTKIVEAISNAGSVAEARTIFDTLQSTVESTPKRGPQSLGEAISRRSSVIRASRHESTTSDPISDRMKKLAGIK